MKWSVFVLRVVLLVLTATSMAFAQNPPTIRVTSSSVVVEQPRGDALVLATVAPGMVLEVLDQRGEWYLVRPRDPGTALDWRTGWINQGQVEFLSERFPRGSAPPVQSPVDEPRLKAKMVEVLIDGSVAGLSVANDTEGVADLDGTVLFLLTPYFEMGATASLFKLAGEDVRGSVGGVLLFNLRDRGRLIPFVLGGAGAGINFPQTTGTPFVLDVSAGVRALTPGGRSAFIIRPFYERVFFGKDGIPDINAFGVSLGLSLFLGG